MKKGLHPQLFLDAKTTCVSCGSAYRIPTTVKVQSVEVCSACHPVYTGEYRGIISSGRVDRFRKIQAVAKKRQEVEKAKPKKVSVPKGKKK